MQISQIKVRNFGKFRDQVFDLTPGSTVFFGLNEAGKSTLVAFINQIMFGFARKSSKNFDYYQFETNPNVYGGQLTFRDDENEWVLERLQAKNAQAGNLRVFFNGTEVPSATFFCQIHQIDQQFFGESFIFDQHTLGQIMSLNQSEIVAQINHLGASNSAELMKLAAQFAKKADQIYKPRGQKLPLNQELTQLTQLEDAVLSNGNQAQAYLELTRQKEPFQAKLQAAKKKDRELTEAIRQEQKLADKIGLLGEYKLLQQSSQVVEFDEASFQRATALISEQESIKNQVAQLKNQIEALQKSRVVTNEDTKAVVDEWSEINHLEQLDGDSAKQISNEQASLEQLYIYQPELRQINQLDATQIDQMRTDFAAIRNLQEEQRKAEEKRQATANNTMQPNLLQNVTVGVAAILLVGGLALLFTGHAMVGLLLFIAAVGASGLAFFVRNKNTTDIRSDNSDSDQHNLLTEQINQFVTQYGIELPRDLNGLLVQASTINDKSNHIKFLQQQVADNQKKIDQYLDRLAVSILPQELDLNNWSSIKQYVQQLKARLEHENQLESSLAANQNLLRELGADLAAKEDALRAILTQNSEESFDSFQETSDKYRKQQQNSEKRANLKHILGSDFERLTAPDFVPAELLSTLEQKKSMQTAVTDNVNELQQQLADINSQQALLGDDRAVIAAQTAVQDQKDQIQEDVVDWLSHKLAAQWINSMLNLASQNRFPKMAVASQKYMKILSGGQYDVLHINDKITVQNSVRKQKLTPSQLSRGTSEQLYFALKLAFIEQIEDEINLPIIIDDAFVNFDDQRVQYMKELLAELGQKHQILVFTARAEIVQLFAENQIVRL